MDSLLIGGLIVLFVNTTKSLNIDRLNRISNITAITSILILITIIYFLGTEYSLTGRFISGYKNFGNESLKYSFGHFKFTALALLFGSIITKIAYKTSRYSTKISAFLDHPILDSIGKTSYGIYIYHWVIFVLLDSINNKLNILPLTIANTYLIFVVKILLTLIVSHLSWKFIESPLNKLKDKFSYSS
ncbi:acyltransferase family protein [Pedobacter sp. NJ-S-72]